MYTHTLEQELGKLGRWERRTLEALLHRRTVAKNTNELFQERLTLGDRVADNVAAMQAPVIMMSQNRQAAKDRLDAQHDYEVNLKSELEITAVQEKLDTLHKEHISELRQLAEQQLEILRRLEQRFAPVEGLRGDA